MEEAGHGMTLDEFKRLLAAYREERNDALSAVRPKFSRPPGSQEDPCQKAWQQVCPALAEWVRKTSHFNEQVYDFLQDEFGFPGGTIDPPPDSPF